MPVSGRMKPTAWLLNVARGPVVQEEALVAALSEGRIGGAALDVYWVQPLPTDHPLRSLPNVILTPHAAGLTMESVETMSRVSATDTVRILAGLRQAQLLQGTEPVSVAIKDIELGHGRSASSGWGAGIMPVWTPATNALGRHRVRRMPRQRAGTLVRPLSTQAATLTAGHLHLPNGRWLSTICRSLRSVSHRPESRAPRPP